MVESYATINFNLGTRSLWRKASIIADATISIIKEDPKTFTGHALIDEVCYILFDFLAQFLIFNIFRII